jgi:Ni,Fe-hydrogenase I large subunit
LYSIISPEALENSKIVNLLNEQLSLKIKDLLELKEISKYIKTKEELIPLLNKCDFLKISNDSETITYDLPEGLTVFSILNIPSKLNKTEVEKQIELDNLQFSRLYKKGFYWILATNDKETIICSQNSLRELRFDDIKVKYDMKNKNQLMKIIKEQIDRNSYQKEAKNLGIKKNEKKYDDKTSNNDSDAFSWRKGSNYSSFDNNE